MPNWCFTTYSVNFDDCPELGQKVYDAINKALSEEWQKTTDLFDQIHRPTSFGKNWYGWLPKFCGIDPNTVDCRGSVDYVEFKDNKLIFETETAWNDKPDSLLLIIAAIAPDKIHEVGFVVEEGDIWTNIPEEAEHYHLFYSGSCSDGDPAKEALSEVIGKLDYSINKEQLEEVYKEIYTAIGKPVEEGLSANAMIDALQEIDEDVEAHSVELTDLNLIWVNEHVDLIPDDAPVREFMTPPHTLE